MLLPPMLFTCTAWRSLGLPWPDLLRAEACALLYFWLALYLVCLSNQATGIEEDRRNKPHRPLVTGVVSVTGAWRRWWVVLVLYGALGYCLGLAGWAALWITMTVCYNQLGFARRWYGKNLCIVIATFAQLAAAWEIAGPLTPYGWRLIAAITFLFNLIMSIQDLRDITGDREVGRRTLPMVIGEGPTRVAAAVGLGALPVAVHFWIFGTASEHVLPLTCEVVLTCVGWATAVRVLRFRDPVGDHRTYQLYTGWYCLLMVGSVLVSPIH
ncbi:UbiA family prenyltransferase [Streptomyces sp. NPDC048278]|uniref:UbiA family prenyltransferase n=1 Tax=Streptomyces sp. NPDC048278 TaxID=3155809 RepID=UPI003418AB7C